MTISRRNLTKAVAAEARPPYPATAACGSTRMLAGSTFPDPFKWLEERGADTSGWEAAQNAFTSAALDALPEGTASAALASRFDVSRPNLPRFASGLWFWIGAHPESDRPLVMVGPKLLGEARVLYETEALHTAVPYISWISPSPDARILALGLCEDGSENNRIVLVDVETGEVRPAAPAIKLMDNWTGGAQWLPDSRGFFFSGVEGPPTGGLQQDVYLHDLARQGETTKVAIPWIEGRHYRAVFTSPGRQWVVAVQGLTNPIPVAVLNLCEKIVGWRPFIREAMGTIAGQIVGDDYVAVTTVGANRGRVVSIPLRSDGDASYWRELVPESASIMRTLIVCGDRIFVTELDDTYSRISMFGLDGSDLGEVPLPGRGAVSEGAFPLLNLAQPVAVDSVLFLFSTLTESWSLFEYRLPGERLCMLIPPAITLADAEVIDCWATSRDGTKIPYHVVRRKGPAEGPRPALVFAYGGYNRPLVPEFPGAMAAVVEAGGLFIHAHLRGGSEFGLNWWLNGRARNKQNCYDDLYAVVEELIRKGWATSDRIALTGNSNGGLLAGVAATQRPDLWAVVVPKVPDLDLVADATDGYLKPPDNEYGDSEDADDLERIGRTSPYHALREGVDYPAMLVIAGETDPRCQPWHASKFIARLQQVNPSGRPALLRIHQNEGHGGATGGKARCAANGEWISFVFDRIGLSATSFANGTVLDGRWRA